MLEEDEETEETDNKLFLLFGCCFEIESFCACS